MPGPICPYQEGRRCEWLGDECRPGRRGCVLKTGPLEPSRSDWKASREDAGDGRMRDGAHGIQP